MAAHFFTLPLFQGSWQLKSEKTSLFTRPRFHASNTTYEAQKPALQKGVLVEFKKDSGRIVLGVTQNREGKRNWSVIDQNADTYIVKPNQIKLVVPGTDNFSPQDVSRLLQEVERLQDPALLEMAWEEMLLDDKTANIEELALILYGSMAPEKCYSAYRLLASNPVYFKCKEDGYSPRYEPRPLAQVLPLIHTLDCQTITLFLDQFKGSDANLKLFEPHVIPCMVHVRYVMGLGTFNGQLQDEGDFFTKRFWLRWSFKG